MVAAAKGETGFASSAVPMPPFSALSLLPELRIASTVKKTTANPQAPTISQLLAARDNFPLGGFALWDCSTSSSRVAFAYCG